MTGREFVERALEDSTLGVFFNTEEYRSDYEQNGVSAYAPKLWVARRWALHHALADKHDKSGTSVVQYLKIYVKISSGADRVGVYKEKIGAAPEVVRDTLRKSCPGTYLTGDQYDPGPGPNAKKYEINIPFEGYQTLEQAIEALGPYF